MDFFTVADNDADAGDADANADAGDADDDTSVGLGSEEHNPCRDPILIAAVLHTLIVPSFEAVAKCLVSSIEHKDRILPLCP